ncbi:MAG: citrate synthase [Verrucomicrobia bacterium]|nr:citrate synthase [Verrucomicrobiota bacterium]
MSKDSLTITDNRTGRQYDIPIFQGTYPTYGAAISTSALRSIKTGPEDFGLMSYDPGFTNTALCKSRITFIDGERGILRHRGYPIDELAENCRFLEVAYLVLYGELPAPVQFEEWSRQVLDHMLLHENTKKFMEGFHHDAHPMGMLVSTVAALSTFYPDAKNIHDQASRRLQTYRLVGKMPTIAAYAYRHNRGLPYIYPSPDLSYTGNFLRMMFQRTEAHYQPNPVLEKALDVLFVLHADHEQNCSTNAMRSVGSSHSDPYMALTAAAAALYGPLHGGANEQVLHMLREIGSKDKVPEYIKRIKTKEVRLMGFGHRVYKNYDPRAKIIKRIADQVFEVTGKNPLLDIALELERIALADDYFISHKLYPNVDFYSGIIYQALGFPVELFPVLFAIPRTCGWIAQWEESLLDTDQKIARPQQVYTGEDLRHVHPLAEAA